MVVSQLNLFAAVDEPPPFGLTEADLSQWLIDAVADGGLRPLEQQLAEWLKRQVPRTPPLARWLAVMASHQAGAGHLCLNLAQLARAPATIVPTQMRHQASLQDYRAALDAAPMLIAPSAEAAAMGLLVRDGDCLYLRRFWRLETQLAARLQARLGWQADPASAPIARAWLGRLFSSADERTWDQQRACALALGQRLTVIMGGPGTGKTTTVLKLLILLQVMAASEGLLPLRMALCAPTGKAAARLRESIAGQLTALLAPLRAEFPELASHLPNTVTTLHRLLGLRPNRPPVHDEANPLSLAVLVIDEASMIGAGLMAATLAALPPNARLILLGDAGQLASVEPGAVLGDISAAVAGQGYHQITEDWLAAVTGLPSEAGHVVDQPDLADACLTLRFSHRFGASSPLGQLAAAVNTGDAALAVSLMDTQAGLTCCPDDAARSALRALADAEIQPWLDRAVAGCPVDQTKTEWATAIFRAMRHSQILCAIREGAYGVAGVNEFLTDYFGRRSVVQFPLRGAGRAAWFAGRPILVTQNDAALGLANGDVGVILADPLHGALQAVFFDEGTQTLRWLNPQRLPSVETAFALTVHKAQGSEFSHSVLLLPPVVNPVLTRELIYTAITRARDRFTLLLANEDGTAVFAAAIGRQVARSGQLAARLAAKRSDGAY